jgi:flagellar motor component MotA
MKLFGWLIIAGAIAGLISGGGNLAYFIEWQSLLWVCLVIIGGVWVSFGPMDAMKAIDAAFISRPNLNDEQVTQYSSVLKLAYQLAWGGGIVGTFAGLIIMLQNI